MDCLAKGSRLASRTLANSRGRTLRPAIWMTAPVMSTTAFEPQIRDMCVVVDGHRAPLGVLSLEAMIETRRRRRQSDEPGPATIRRAAFEESIGVSGRQNWSGSW